MQLNFNRTVERMAKDYGVWEDAPVVPSDGAATTTPAQNVSSALGVLPVDQSTALPGPHELVQRTPSANAGTLARKRGR
jgi:hypothetical protein